MVVCIGIVICDAGGCMSLGNVRYKRLGNKFSIVGSLVQFVGLAGIYLAYTQVATTVKPEKVLPMFPSGFFFFLVIAAIILITSIANQIALPKCELGTKFEMESKFKLFLMFLPFIALVFVFSYLPLWGWRYAFFDYKSGGTLSLDNFVGFKWFTYLFQNEATRKDIVRVLRNTLAMSGLGIATSWVSMAFAIFLSEIKSSGFRRFVQIFTTIPNFISWVLVYAIALAIFASDGFINSIFINLGWVDTATNYLMGDSFTWLKMLAWGMWKGMGWGAIIYIAAISGIDQQLYEAATVDGAGRFQKMWHITLPGLIPTYFVLLLLSVAGILTNGMDQYLLFENPTNTNTITVLDLYVYNLGIVGGSIPLSTVVGMVKSVVSVVLLFVANNASKLVRGESII
jgi:putative aldouronate transport system permease protein